MGKRKVIFLLVLLFTIGFASITGTLILTNTLNLAFNDDFKVIFTDAVLDNHRNLSLISGDKQSITFETKKMISTVEVSMFEYEATNTSRNYDAEVVISCKLNGTDEINIKDYLSIGYDPRNMIIGAGESKRGNITIKLTKQVLEDEDLDLKCMLEATPVERESLGEEYVNPNDQSRVLMTPEFIDTYDTRGAFWNYKEYITKVVFENEFSFHEASTDMTFDVSTLQDGSVMAYLVENGSVVLENEEKLTYSLYIQSANGVIANWNSSYLFSGFIRLKSIEGFEYFDTSNVVDMSNMFERCFLLESLDVSNFDTSNVTNMQAMFSFGGMLSQVNQGNNPLLRGIITDSLLNSTISKINGLENFDTSKVTNMANMFMNADALISIDVDNFNTSNVTNMMNMFYGCKTLENLSLINFDTSNVVDMFSMFSKCLLLKNLDISSFDFRDDVKLDGFLYNMSFVSNVIVKNEEIKARILNLDFRSRPSAWTEENVIVKA